MELSVNESDAKEVKAYYEKRGTSGLHDFLIKKRDEWIDTPVHVAISGSSGCGKSSFINSIRGLTAEDKNGAALNVGDSTIEPIPYSHPNKHYLKFWDLPQLGTPAFSKDLYLKNSHFERYDYFLLFTKNTFTEDDLWFIEQIQAAKKTHFFVRTHVDPIVEKAMQENEKGEPDVVQRKALTKVREEVIKSIKDYKEVELKVNYVYLMNTYDTRRFDYPNLAHQLINSLSQRKREAMALTIHVLGSDVMKQKRQALQKRIWIIALLSSLDGAVPIYGLPYDLDLNVVIGEVNEYRMQFGLDDGSMLRIAKAIGTTIDNLKKASSFKTNYGQLVDGGLVNNFKTLGVYADIADGITKSFSPILGGLITGKNSFGSTYYVLLRLLDVMETDALRMIDYVRYRDAIFD